MVEKSNLQSRSKFNSPKQANTYFFLIILGLMIIGLHFLIFQQRNELGLSSTSEGFYDTPKKVIGSAFREIRVTIADILWIRVDTYFHSSLTKEEHEMIHPGHPEHEVGEEEGHHEGGSGAEFLPLIRLVVDLDPNFIEAYRIGAWWLWFKLNEPQPAIDFLKEGIENNPERFELHYELACLYFHKLEKYSLAKQELQESDKIMESASYSIDDHDRGSVLELLGFTCERLSENQEALTIWRKLASLNISPYSVTAKRRIAELTQIQVPSKEKSNGPKNS